MKVVFSNRAFASILAETTEKIKTETGGLFLGTIQEDVWYVVEAIDPGPKSIFKVDYFEYDQGYTEHLINKIANLYDEKLTLIGLWHRHPGSFDKFSFTDDGTNKKYASMNEKGAISALVNIDPKFRLTVYHVDKPCRYSKITYSIGDELIPDKYLKLKSQERLMKMMDNILNRSNSQRTRKNGEYKVCCLASFMKSLTPKIEDKLCSVIETSSHTSLPPDKDYLTDMIFDDLLFITDDVGLEVHMSLNENQLVVYQETKEKITNIYFMYSTSIKSVVISFEDRRYLYHKGLLKEAFLKSIEDKNSEECNEEAPIKPTTRQNGIVDTVIKIVNFNKREG